MFWQQWEIGVLPAIFHVESDDFPIQPLWVGLLVLHYFFLEIDLMSVHSWGCARVVLMELIFIVPKDLVFWFPAPIGLVGVTLPFHKILQLVLDKF